MPISMTALRTIFKSERLRLAAFGYFGVCALVFNCARELSAAPIASMGTIYILELRASAPGCIQRPTQRAVQHWNMGFRDHRYR